MRKARTVNIKKPEYIPDVSGGGFTRIFSGRKAKRLPKLQSITSKEVKP